MSNKKIEIIQGNGNLKISKVDDHLEVEKPKSTPNKKAIIIPTEKNNKK